MTHTRATISLAAIVAALAAVSFFVLSACTTSAWQLQKVTAPSGGATCGNGTCETTEDSTTCPADCGGEGGGGNQNAACDAPKNDLFKNPFSKDSAQHRPMGTGAIYASDSDPSTKNWLRAYGFNLNVGSPYGSFIIEGKESDPLTTVTCDPNYSRACSGVPVTLRIPSSVPGSGGNTDSTVDLYDGSTGTLHEFYQFYPAAGSYRAAIHKAMPIHGLGHTPVGQNIRLGIGASGIAIFNGLLRGHEVNTPGYKIQHTLNVMVPSSPGRSCSVSMSQDAHIWPASGKDVYCGSGACSGHIPYGALLAIPPVSKGGPNLDSLGLSEPGKRVAEALRDYGAYMHDTSGCVAAMRTDQFISNTVKLQIKADLAKVYKYIRMVKNNNGNEPVSGVGTPLAPNCAFDAQ